MRLYTLIEPIHLNIIMLTIVIRISNNYPRTYAFIMYIHHTPVGYTGGETWSQRFDYTYYIIISYLKTYYSLFFFPNMYFFFANGVRIFNHRIINENTTHRRYI